MRAQLKNFRGEKEQVVAAAVRLIDKLGCRVGNDRYLRENKTRGVSTLNNKNVRLLSDGDLKVRFTGKGGREISTRFSDPVLAKAIDACHELPGHRLFTYLGSDGESHPVDSADINGFLTDLYAENITAKDLRTWRASAEAVGYLRRISEPKNPEAEFREAVRFAAGILSNRYATCRKHYVHPKISEAYAASGPKGFSDRSTDARPELQQAECLLLEILRE